MIAPETAVATAAAATALGALAVSRARSYGVPLRLGASYVAAALVAAPLIRLAVSNAAAYWSASVALAIGSVCAVTDLQTGYVFDRVLLAGSCLALGAALADRRIAGALAGAALAGTLLGLLFAMSRGRGIGLGDVKLALVLGACLGTGGALRAVGFAFVVGALFAVVLLFRGARRTSEVRFAPFLALGAAYALLASVR